MLRRAMPMLCACYILGLPVLMSLYVPLSRAAPPIKANTLLSSNAPDQLVMRYFIVPRGIELPMGMSYVSIPSCTPFFCLPAEGFRAAAG